MLASLWDHKPALPICSIHFVSIFSPAVCSWQKAPALFGKNGARVTGGGERCHPKLRSRRWGRTSRSSSRVFWESSGSCRSSSEPGCGSPSPPASTGDPSTSSCSSQCSSGSSHSPFSSSPSWTNRTWYRCWAESAGCAPTWRTTWPPPCSTCRP